MHALGVDIKSDLYTVVKSDGNCVYRAVSDQLTGEENLHDLYRKFACDYIQAHRDDYEPFVEDETFEEYLEDISQEGVWAGNIELQALSLALDVNIMIHRAVGTPTRIEGSGGGRWLHLAYQLGNHYNSLRLIGNPAGPAEEIPLSLFEAEVIIPQSPPLPAAPVPVSPVPPTSETHPVPETAEPMLRHSRPDVYPDDNAKCWCGSKRRYYKCCKPLDTFK